MVKLQARTRLSRAVSSCLAVCWQSAQTTTSGTADCGERAAWMDDQCDQLVGRSAGGVGRAGGGRAVGGHDVTGRRDEAGTPLQSDAARRRLPAGHAARRARDRRRLQAPAGQRRHGAQTHRLPTSNVRRRRRRRRQLTDGQHRLQRCCCRHY